MNILQLHTQEEWGGGEDQVLKLLVGLKARNRNSPLMAHPHGALIRKARDAGIETYPLPLSSRVKANPFGHVGLSREIRSLGVDLIHAHDSMAIGRGGQAGKRLDIPVVASRRIASPLRSNRASSRKYGPDCVSRIIAISETVRAVLIDSGVSAERIDVVDDGLDFAAVDQASPLGELRDHWSGYLVGGLGRLSKKKNWSYLLETAAVLKSRGHDIRWVLAGAGPEADNLKTMARERGLADAVVWLGFHDQPLSVLKSLDVLFFPSLMEGSSVTVREAMASRVPVVTADTPGSVESLNGHGWVIPAAAPDQAADAVWEALTNSAKREERTEKAYQDAKLRFPIEITVQKTLDVYSDVVGE